MCKILEVAGAIIRLDFDGRTDDNRQQVKYTIALPGAPDNVIYEANDIRSGVGAYPTLDAMAGSLLCFLSACGESFPEHDSPFPMEIAEWCSLNQDELDWKRDELEGE